MSLTRRTFLVSSVAGASGFLLPVSAQESVSATESVWSILQRLIEAGTIGEIRRIHVECGRDDGPDVASAIAGLHSALGELTLKKVSACGGEVVGDKLLDDFLVTLQYGENVTVVLTSTQLGNSWGTVRGASGRLELYGDVVVQMDAENNTRQRIASTLGKINSTVGNVDPHTFAVQALSEARTLYPAR